MATEGARDYAALKEKQSRLMAELVTIRAEMHRLEDHALIESVNLLDTPEPPHD